MDLCLGMDEKATESLWARTKKQTSMGDIVVDVCYKLIRNNKWMRPSNRQTGAALHLQDLVLIGNFNHPVMCWRDNRAGEQGINNLGGSWSASMTNS